MRPMRSVAADIVLVECSCIATAVELYTKCVGFGPGRSDRATARTDRAAGSARRRAGVRQREAAGRQREAAGGQREAAGGTRQELEELLEGAVERPHERAAASSQEADGPSARSTE